MKNPRSTLSVLAWLVLTPLVAEAQNFVFRAPDQGVATSTLGGDQFAVPFAIEQTEGAAIATLGFSMSVAHDPSILSVEDIDIIGALATVANGSPPTFTGFDLLSNGWAASVIYAINGAELLFPQSEEVLLVHYQTVAELSTETTSSLQFTPVGAVTENAVAIADAMTISAQLQDGSVTLIPSQSYQRGDCNVDGSLGLSDILVLLFYQFAGGQVPSCFSACDFDGDGDLDLSDSIFIQQYLYLGGAAPPAPLMACGVGIDALGCDSFAMCP